MMRKLITLFFLLSVCGFTLFSQTKTVNLTQAGTLVYRTDRCRENGNFEFDNYRKN